MTHRSTAAVTAALLTCLVNGRAQTNPARHPQFEAASVKPNHSGDPRIQFPPPVGGRFTATNIPLNMLLSMAYKVRVNNISGGPSWMSVDRYDIEAKAEGNPAPEEMNRMIRSLLEDRFGVAAHYETRDLPVYALVAAKNGPRLPAPKEGACTATPAGKALPPIAGQPLPTLLPTPCGGIRTLVNRLEGGNVGMAQLANALANVTRRSVLDQTGYNGMFDVQLNWTPDGESGKGGPADDSGPSLFTALQEQLGLRLESQKGPVEVLVVDHAGKATEN
jgi:uncharacterized protein (TIGR03435 family)